MLRHSREDQSIHSWNIPTLHLKNELLNPNEDFSVKKYSILDPRFTFRTAKELAELLQVFPDYQCKDILKLVSFRPDRVAYHELIAGINLKFKITDETQLQGLVFQLYESLKTSSTYQQIINSANEQRAAIEKLTTDIVTHQEIPKSLSFTQQVIMNKLDSIKSLFNGGLTFGRYVEGYTEEKALIALVSDAVYREQVLPEIHQYIYDLLDRVISQKPQLELTVPNPQERLTVMIAGGQASGKSAAVEILKSHLEKNHLNFDDFIKLNADNFKPLVLQPGSVNKYLYSQLAQPEATHVRILIQRQIENMILEKKAANLYVDQVFLGAKKVNFSLQGQGVIAVVISTPVEGAIIRSFLRGEQVENEQGRFEHTSGVLAGHKGVAEKFFQHIFNYIGSNLSVVIYDNSVSLSKPPTEVMQLDFVSIPPKAIIFDLVKLKAFIKKMTINVDAKNEDEVYPANCQAKTEELYAKFIQDLNAKGFLIMGKPNTVSNQDVHTFLSHTPQNLVSPTENEKNCRLTPNNL